MQRISIHPHPLGPVFCQQTHQAGVLAIAPDAPQIVATEMANSGLEEISQIPSRPICQFVAKRFRRGWIGQQNDAVHVMDTEQAKAVFDQKTRQLPRAIEILHGEERRGVRLQILDDRSTPLGRLLVWGA